MKRNKFSIIFPQDETTDFLSPIPQYLFDKLGRNHIDYFRIGFSKKEHTDCLDYLVNDCPKDAFIVFLGHGRSDALLGSISDSHSFSREIFLEKNNIHVLRRKKVFCLACKSREFIDKGNIHGIGFGNLPTSMTEVNQARQGNVNRYYGVQNQDINTFNEILVSVVKRSIADFILKSLTFHQFYLELKLRFNRSIIKLIQENEPKEMESLVNLIYEAKTEMYYSYQKV